MLRRVAVARRARPSWDHETGTISTCRCAGYRDGMTTAARPGTLADTVRAFGRSAFLVSVTPESRPHLAPVDVDLDRDGTSLSVAVLSGARGARNAAANAVVCLHWPPVDDSNGYSLIVDGESTLEVRAHDTLLHVRPMKAVLHRPGDPEPGTTACGHDCVGLSLER